MPAQPAVPPDRHALLFNVYQAMDADRSGYVDAEEFKGIFTQVGEKHSDERLAEIDAIRGRGDTDGKLSAKEFCQFFLEYMADKADAAFLEQIDLWNERLLASRRRLLLRRVFARMDTDRSGSVSLEEFRQLADDDVGADNSEAYFRWIESAQGDSNGLLTSEEWVPFVLETEAHTSDDEFESLVQTWLLVLAKKRRVTLLRQVFQKMDADASGEVDIKEFEALNDGSGPSSSSTVLTMIFHYLDSNNGGNSDGMLSVDEWVVGMRAMGETMDDAEFEAEIAKWAGVLSSNQRAIWRAVFARYVISHQSPTNLPSPPYVHASETPPGAPSSPGGRPSNSSPPRAPPVRRTCSSWRTARRASRCWPRSTPSARATSMRRSTGRRRTWSGS